MHHHVLFYIYQNSPIIILKLFINFLWFHFSLYFFIIIILFKYLYFLFFLKNLYFHFKEIAFLQVLNQILFYFVLIF